MLSHQQIMSRRSSSSSTPTQNNGAKSESLHQKALQQIQAIQAESGDAGLLRTLQALVSNVREATTQTDDTKKNLKDILRKALGGGSSPTPAEDPFESTHSSEPTGGAWTLGAIIKNLETITGLTPTNTKAIKELLGLPIPYQSKLIKAVVERLLSTNAPVNDRNNTFEAVMKIMGTMGPEQDEIIYALTQPLINEFHNDIHKPFVNFVGHNFRTADGSYNSLWFPDIGKAGTNYMRAVTARSPVNENLPDPTEVFRRVLKRQEFEPHNSGINMLLLYLGIIITHDLFYTDPKNPLRNLTTSYADLSPLYGFNREDQESVRQMKKGLLKPDQWFDKRLVIQPPGVAGFLVLFSRNHNYIAKTLLEKNEGGRFSFGRGNRLATEADQDEELFQTARLINNACYYSIILQEYVRTIVGVRQDAHFVFDVLAQAQEPVYGNAVSIEFNVVYRWHQAIGKEDTEWIDTVMGALEGPMRSIAAQQRTPSQAGTDQSLFEAILKVFNEKFVNASPEELAKGLPIAGIHRDINTGEFSDADITKMLRRGYDQIASELGNGQNTPASLEHVEILGIQQCRELGCCTFNELRRHLNLVPLTSFEDFSNKPEVQKALEELYGTPDQVELYTGLMVERCKVTGLRLPYTTGRAILSDAVNLLRNDRILTQELTPTNLTNWGFEYSLGKKLGRVLPRMLKTLLPQANANGLPAFSDEEIDTLFTVPSAAHPKAKSDEKS
ncbi:heme peroxidase [Fennellomyces sp. T-0311]|nr:heme peroxidase [Fennellomyces sp. T-0311]